METSLLYFTPVAGREYCDERVGLGYVSLFFSCVCPRVHLRKHTANLHQLFVPVTWRRCDKLSKYCRFMADFVCTQWPELHGARRKDRIQNVTQQETARVWHILNLTYCQTVAKFDIYDCLICRQKKVGLAKN